MKITSFLMLFTFLFSYQGEIVSIEFMDFMNIEDVQNDLDDTFGSVAPEAQYDISIYKIVYKTIDPFGEETNASGIISFPHNIDQAFPMMSFQHGTVVARDNVASEDGFNPLSLWLTSTGYIYIEPDYLGLGVSEGMHPYQLKEPYGTAVVVEQE